MSFVLFFFNDIIFGVFILCFSLFVKLDFVLVDFSLVCFLIFMFVVISIFLLFFFIIGKFILFFVFDCSNCGL